MGNRTMAPKKKNAAGNLTKELYLLEKAADDIEFQAELSAGFTRVIRGALFCLSGVAEAYARQGQDFVSKGKRAEMRDEEYRDEMAAAFLAGTLEPSDGDENTDDMDSSQLQAKLEGMERMIQAMKAKIEKKSGKGKGR